MDHIDEHLATAALNLDYPLAIKAALAVGKATLNRYYNKTDHSEVYRIAMGMVISLIQMYIDSFYLCCSVLHPRHKLDYFKKAGWEQAWIDKAKEIVRAEFERSYKYSGDPIFAEPTTVSQSDPQNLKLAVTKFADISFNVCVTCKYIRRFTGAPGTR